MGYIISFVDRNNLHLYNFRASSSNAPQYSVTTEQWNSIRFLRIIQYLRKHCSKAKKLCQYMYFNWVSCFIVPDFHPFHPVQFWTYSLQKLSVYKLFIVPEFTGFTGIKYTVQLQYEVIWEKAPFYMKNEICLTGLYKQNISSWLCTKHAISSFTRWLTLKTECIKFNQLPGSCSPNRTCPGFNAWPFWSQVCPAVVCSQ